MPFRTCCSVYVNLSRNQLNSWSTITGHALVEYKITSTANRLFSESAKISCDGPICPSSYIMTMRELPPLTSEQGKQLRQANNNPGQGPECIAQTTAKVCEHKSGW